jgi:hypothetical protein
LAVWFEETYQVEASETIAKWHELTGMNITVKEGEVSHDEVQSLDVDSTKNGKSKKIPKTKDVCQHIFLSGQKVGEQCTTKPKGGASYCSAHRPKDSVKSAKSAKTPKKKDVKKVEKIDSEFGSDSEQEAAPVKVVKKSKKEKVEKAPQKRQKKITDMTEDSDSELETKAEEDSDEENLSEPQTPVKPLLKKKALKNGPVKPQKKAYETDEETLDKDLNLSDDD